MGTSGKDQQETPKLFPSVARRGQVNEEHCDKELEADLGPSPLPSDSPLYHRIKEEIEDFRLANASNPRLGLLLEKYLSVQREGCGDRWEGPPYLGLAHLEQAQVFPAGSMRRASQFSKWTNGGATPFPFTKKDARRLLQFLWNQPGWNEFNRIAKSISEIPNAYYFSLIQALESGHATHENLAFAAPGIYQCYRQSTLMPHAFVAGLLAVIGHGEAIRTFEVHRFEQAPQPAGATAANSLPSIFEIYEGWMVKKSHQILIHAFDCVTRAFHLTVISNALSSPSDFSASAKPTKRNSKFQIMSGIATGVVGQLGFYSVPAVYTRLGDLDIAMPNAINAADSGALVQAVLETMKDSAVSGQAYQEMNMIGAEKLPELVRVQIETVRRQYRQQGHGDG